jgi:hypothetical protein
MALYEIVRDFKGSQDGRFAEDFKAGTVRDLSAYLAAAIDPTWARAVVEKPAEPIASPAAPITSPAVAQSPAVENKESRHLFTRRGKGPR